MPLGNLLQGYLAAKQGNQAADTANIQQAGALQQLFAKQQEAQRAQQFRAEISQAQTPEARLAIAQKYMGANQLGTSIQGSQNAAATREASAAQRDATLGQARSIADATLAERQAGREQRSSDAALSRDQRMREVEMRLAESRTAGAERAALARELAMMRAEQQRESAEFRQRTDPAALKMREKEQGKKEVTDIVKFLHGNYKSLETQGADIDPSQSSLKNAWERASGSAAGQIMAGAVGTKAQESRDQINAARASLMGALKKATGMGATQLNSNVELKFYLNMATDVTKARWANRAALAYLDKTYGLGAGITANPEEIAKLQQMMPGYMQSPQEPSGTGDEWTPEKEQRYQELLRKKRGGS